MTSACMAKISFKTRPRSSKLAASSAQPLDVLPQSKEVREDLQEVPEVGDVVPNIHRRVCLELPAIKGAAKPDIGR